MASEVYKSNLKEFHKEEPDFIRKEKIQKMTPFLLKWYQENARILPWRDNPLPYYVWVSEIMLQQTRVEAVKPYFSRFIEALPDIEALANAQEEVLLKLWEGLGYYNRVRNLQKAALQVMKEYGGILPKSYEKLLDLPGIGSYTAGAIASIAYKIPVPAVDGNVLRVLSRLMEDREDILKQSVKKRAEKLLKETMPKERASDFNQAMMELGAIICLPNGLPKCEECPISSVCSAKQKGVMMELPVKSSKKPRKIEERTILLISNNKKIAIHKRADKGLLAGLYEFPNIMGRLSLEEVKFLLEKQNLQVNKIQQIMRAKHIFSHIEWHMIGYEIELKEPSHSFLNYEIELEEERFSFKDIKELEENYSIPNAFAVYKEYLKKWLQLGEEESRL